MKVELRLYASLQGYLPIKDGGNVCAVEIPEGSTIRDLLQRFGVPQIAVKVIFRNGVHAQSEEILKEGDRVGAFPPVAGG